MNDDLHGIFDDIDPSDFETTFTTAVLEEVPAPSFDAFIDSHLRLTRLAYTLSDGALQPFAALSGPDTQRIFAPDDDENNASWVGRLTNEARRISANRLYITRRAEVGTMLATAGEIVNTASDDPKVLEEARKFGQVFEAMWWYAEQRDGGDVTRRQGFLTIVEKTRLGANTEAEIAQRVDLLATILGEEIDSDT